MKIQYIVALAAATAVITTLALVPLWAKGNGETRVIRETSVVSPSNLSSGQIIWLARLMQCESGLKSSAINPKDLDNTPSYGLLQFKPSTYASAATKYGLASTTDYMNPQGQVDIVTHWILEKGTNWHTQFPACVEKLGIPPQQ